VTAATATLTRLIAESPLRLRAFRLFYFGTICSALGYTMQSTIAAWVMATLTPSALMVALVQSASTAPTLLFGMIAGTLADIIERRTIVLTMHVVLFLATALLGVATLTGIIGPTSLLLLTFVIGASFTFYQPAAQASVNDLVGRAELGRAVALGSVAFNVARAAGPALAGAIAAFLNTGSALIASAVCFIVMAYSAWTQKARERALPGVPETLVSGVLVGLRYARHSATMRALIVVNLTFSLCGSAFWALLPVIARDQLHLGAGGFGLLSAAFGTGAIAGALSMSRLLSRRKPTSVIALGIALWTLAILLIAATEITPLAVAGSACAGVAWVAVYATLSSAVQSSAPAWVRARALATTMVALMASLAVGSALWGALATLAGTHIALAASAGVLVLLYVVNRRVRVEMGREADVTASMHLPELAIKAEPMPDDGPVLIQREYTIDPAVDIGEFLRAIHALAPMRRRNGATSWRVFRDLQKDGAYVERYIIASWAEYVRLRSRMTIADRELEQNVGRYQCAGVPIRVSRLIGVEPVRPVVDREPEA
jgi:MFS family permease